MTDVKQQNTHWYRAGGRFSFTADPTQADQGEVERVGLHDCEELRCQIFHYGNSVHYSLWLLQYYFGGDAG
jgi:hypothetical protein